MSASAYWLAYLELEAGDSGVLSLVSVQGSLAVFAIHRWGLEDQKRQWLARMVAGDAIGCFGLTEADSGSEPGSRHTRARRDGSDWVLHGPKMWITNGSMPTWRSSGPRLTRVCAVSWCPKAPPDSARGTPTEALHAGLGDFGADLRRRPVRLTRSSPKPSRCAPHFRVSTRQASGSCGVPSARRGLVWRRRSTTA